MTSNQIIKVEKHDTRITTGGRICGTRVIFADGRVIDFAARLSKREAIKQAMYQLAKEVN
jgi:hypothetical protein